jgi:hypothetical protein
MKNRSLLVLALLPARMVCQDNVLDLRIVEFNTDRHVTYQNFIYARAFAGGKLLAQANYLRLPRIDYDEVAVGVGLRIASLAGTDVYVMAGVGKATDATYAEPALLALKSKGRLSGSVYFQRYQPVNDAGIVQWLIDPLELQYAMRGPISIGASFYAYQPEGGDWLTKIGPKLALADKHGATEVRVTTVNPGGGREIQLRRIVVF